MRPPMHPILQPQRIGARTAHIGGGVPVNRLVPTRERRMIGAWCFLDHAGPATFEDGSGMRVGPHPHIALQTFTWLIEGEVLHRDSLGHVQVIRPGQVNLMTAGHGIAHTEESLPGQTRIHAAQLWIALPAELADCPPAFQHYPLLPVWLDDGCRITLLAGRWGNQEAPTRIHSPLVAADLYAEQAVHLSLPLDPAFEYGILPLEGSVAIGNENFAVNELAYLPPGHDSLPLSLPAGTHALLIGGAPYGSEVLMAWNFVGQDKAVIAQAQRDWEAEIAADGDASSPPRFGKVEGYDGAPLPPPPLPWIGV